MDSRPIKREKTIDEVYNRIEKYLDNDTYIVGHNVDFDIDVFIYTKKDKIQYQTYLYMKNQENFTIEMHSKKEERKIIMHQKNINGQS